MPDLNVYYPNEEKGIVFRRQGEDITVDFIVGMTAFVGHVPKEHMDKILIAIPKNGRQCENIGKLMRVPFNSVLFDWDDFRDNFEIEVAPPKGA